ncbi:UDP-2-acetamido-2-deoxy-ribo-hexuluronate aminotransferase [Aquimarina sp. MAR_2010_214]|uniref:DegT/DnrJ/EryC1/StrS family aminotransferase n=1 Tax=Aquimarina sp. MAR_2010_214 TaxID=1250026 RepID=UPI000C70AB42|nr:DegT/DnrJ/EryC1/StrS family aminotransferase [Aquimarina sp. MAR_2010_214]PKV48774.1 UDP-2-acetamido-2-deoxy-ribo-hexuluronate aminotransferase [Aquimarina sp. MAR_2010_214]
MKIDFANLTKAYLENRKAIDRAMSNVVSSSRFIMGEEVQELEKQLQQYTGSKHAITCASGTDALILAMMALDIKPGDEIITSPFTFIASAETIAFLGAIPVFVDIDEATYNIDANQIEGKITKKTKAIMPVSLYGQVANMDTINNLAEKYDLAVIEDAAQSFGATYKGKKSCNLSTIGCTSFFPAKPLGCFGDGGALFTDNKALSDKIKSIRVHGQTQRYIHKYIGIGGRLDTLQAAILIEKLKHYDKDVKRRQIIAKKYDEYLTEYTTIPIIEEHNTSVWAQYSIRVKDRNNVQEKLKEKGIPTAVHYPRPLHLQECFEYLGYKTGDFPIAESVSDEIMSLPMNPYLTAEEINYIAEELKKTL